MPISFVAAGAAVTGNNNASALTLAAPAVQAGDFLVAFVGHGQAGGTTNISPPTEWTVVRQPVDAKSPGIFTKVATAADSQANFSFSGSYLGGVILAYRGVGGVDVSASAASSGFQSGITAPTVTTTTANDVVIECVTATGSSLVNVTPPATSRVAATGGSNSSTAVAVGVSEQIQAVAGNSAAETFTFSSAYLHAVTVALKPLPPSAPTVTSPAANATLDPRLPINVAFTYSDPSGNPQTAYQADYSGDGGTTWTSVSSGTTATSFTIPANTLPDTSSITLRIRTSSVNGYGDYGSVTFRADSWIYPAEISGTATTQSLDTTGWVPGDYQVEVATADSVGYGPYSAPQTVTAITTNVSYRVGGAWQSVPRFVRNSAGAWVQSNPAKK